MKFKELIPSLLLTSVFVTLVTTPTRSEEISSIEVPKRIGSGEKSERFHQQTSLVTKASLVKPITEIRRISEMERPAKSADLLVQSPTPQTAPSPQVALNHVREGKSHQ